ncbi:hypothetical protein HCN44_009351 [Aphidius gifuensis]|uniref:Ig-like domain-containing protein n=1 Tax=Aphidius gifuensis TaxID=684658 RepID=A0A835CXZ9_APHGI|nr:hypothetical protein HCN44_009351 [Aphidius gifuensis]
MSLGSNCRGGLFLMLTIFTIVNGNHHRHRHQDIYHQNNFINNNRSTKNLYNISLIEAKINAQLPPLRLPRLRHHHVNHWDPYFENADGQEINGSQRVALHLGSTAMLDCRVAMLADKTVMWTRQGIERPFLLTLGKDVHISNPRYSINFQYPNNWRLTIESVRRDDNGQYACQVNTHPPKTLITDVNILAPNVKIVDEFGHELRDRYYKTGSSIALICSVRSSNSIFEISHPAWSKSGFKLPKYIQIHQTNRSHDESVMELYIKSATKTDSGEYSCSIGELSTAVVHIHVLNGIVLS